MRRALNSILMSGMAIATAGAVYAGTAVSPIPANPPPVPPPITATEVVSPHVVPTAFVNPFVTWGEFIGDTAGNIANIGRLAVSEPPPIIIKVTGNQIANIRYLIRAGAGNVAALGPVIASIPGALRDGVTYLINGELVQALGAVLAPAGQAARILLVGTAGAFAAVGANIVGNAVRAGALALLLVAPAVLGTVASVGIVAGAISVRFLGSLVLGNWPTVISEVLNAPPRLLDAALNGVEGNLGFSFSLPIIGSVGVQATLGLPGLLGGNPTGVTVDAPFFRPIDIMVGGNGGVVPTLLRIRSIIADALRPIDPELVPGGGGGFGSSDFGSSAAGATQTAAPALPAAPMPIPAPIPAIEQGIADVQHGVTDIQHKAADVTTVVNDTIDQVAAGLAPAPAAAGPRPSPADLVGDIQQASQEIMSIVTRPAA
ncbi:MAG: hypothetical protein SW127_04435 [Actinomycetota bacterium]|nr:hypothetical protein [Actinomycetota bacterium]